jgi:hypothetical protein
VAKSTSVEVNVLNARSHVWYIGWLVLVGGAALLVLFAARGVLVHPFTNTADATIYAEAGFRIIDPSLYANDPVISFRVGSFFTTFYALLPDRWEALENVGTTYVALSFFFALAFGIGVYLLSYEIFQRQDVAWLTALVSAIVGRNLMLTPWGWGVRVVTPRFVVFGLAPWLLWLYWRWRHSWRVALVFAALGALLFMHPRFSIYPATLMAIGLLLQERPSVRHWARVAVRAASFALILLIVVVLSVDRLGVGALGEGGVSADAGVSVKDAYAFPSRILRPLAFSIVEAAVPVGLGVLGWRSKRRGEGVRPDEREAFLTFSLVPIGLYVVLWLAIQWLPGVKLLGIERFLTYAYLVPYGFAAYWLIDLWRQGDLKRRLMAAMALGAMIVVTYGQVRVWFLDDNAVYRRRVDMFYERFAPAELQERRTAVLAEAARADDIEDDWDSFLALCDWARASTDVDAVFVVPPADFSLFRLYSQRSLYASAKNVGDLWREYEAATAAYTAGTLEGFQSLRDLRRADYVVVEREKLTLPAPLVYENQRYLVYVYPASP